MIPRQLLQAFDDYLDGEREEEALTLACSLAQTERYELAALFEHLQGYRCDPARKARALSRLRAALKLSPIPGPVCRR